MTARAFRWIVFVPFLCSCAAEISTEPEWSDEEGKADSPLGALAFRIPDLELTEAHIAREADRVFTTRTQFEQYFGSDVDSSDVDFPNEWLLYYAANYRLSERDRARITGVRLGYRGVVLVSALLEAAGATCAKDNTGSQPYALVAIDRPHMVPERVRFEKTYSVFECDEIEPPSAYPPGWD